ncbi:MAG: hypothetical protein PF692_06765 [Kiritimatiellae bacterium]|nr:hypothetical protein [Kiritimatiellia bacterium]
MKQKAKKPTKTTVIIARILILPSLISCVTWAIISGFWMLKLAQGAVDKWIVEPWGIPFIRFMDSDTLLLPFAPFHALFTRFDWLPLASICLFSIGTRLFWKLTKKITETGFPEEDPQPSG